MLAAERLGGQPGVTDYPRNEQVVGSIPTGGSCSRPTSDLRSADFVLTEWRT